MFPEWLQMFLEWLQIDHAGDIAEGAGSESDRTDPEKERDRLPSRRKGAVQSTPLPPLTSSRYPPAAINPKVYAEHYAAH